MKMKDQLKKEVGQRLRNIRNKIGVTQQKFVTNFGVGRADYSRIEKGQIFPGPAILHVLHYEYNVSLDYLIGGTGDMFNIVPDPQLTALLRFLEVDDSAPEIKEMLAYMANVPMVKHAMLSFFFHYKVENRALLHKQDKRLLESKEG